MPVLIVELLRKRYRVEGVPSDEQLATIAKGQGLVVVNWRFRTERKELYCDGYLALRVGLSRPWRRWLLAHGLMHHLVHVGRQSDNLASILVARQERMADLAAGYLLWYNHVAHGRAIMPWQLAEIAEVPVECVLRWHALVVDLVQEALASPLAQSQSLEVSHG